MRRLLRAVGIDGLRNERHRETMDEASDVHFAALHLDDEDI